MLAKVGVNSRRVDWSQYIIVLITEFYCISRTRLLDLREVPSWCRFSLSQSVHTQTHRHYIPQRPSPLHPHQETCTPEEIYNLKCVPVSCTDDTDLISIPIMNTSLSSLHST